MATGVVSTETGVRARVRAGGQAGLSGKVGGRRLRDRRPRPDPAPVVVGALAAAVRLALLLRGTGLYGYGNYDDGVHFAAALALVDGRLPYRDFLLLHPPGILLVLSPFAALSRWVREPAAFAVARIAWCLLGGVNAALVVAVLRRRSRPAAWVAGLFYAGYWPAVFDEHLTLLETPQALVQLLAVLVLVRALGRTHPAARAADGTADRTTDETTGGAGARPTDRWVPWLLAGVLVGASPCLKIWGAASVLVLAGWVLAVRGARRALLVVAGAAATAVAVCLPFWLAAPGPMWREVVLDQLGRQHSSLPPTTRVAAIVGLQNYGIDHPGLLLSVLPGLALLLVVVLAATDRGARPLVALFAVEAGALLLTPTWYQHYPAFAAGPLALVVGSAFAVVLDRWHRRSADRARLRRAGTAGLALVTVAALAAVAVPSLTTRIGLRFPHRTLAVAARTRGCVTSDDPINLIELDVVGRNIARRCRVVVDLGGFIYDERVHGHEVPRADSPAFQTAALAYLGSGATTVLSRLQGPDYLAFTEASLRRIRSWPLLAVHADSTHGDTTVRAPGRVASAR
ncbi:hypothetical protein FHX74_000203 [Friedmanniella endophytica]|uniref:Uncharacterized protein n=1 Tax=Microlunatus kandeliicorticis TaxID=1759536 RepID=A0A7W3IP14_9ACTN|nr:hypothetical protein [Microlunatus kandeliicorticis]MBA8792609.1 hypothetical protein [Microlunatus kandeliicorticis]